MPTGFLIFMWHVCEESVSDGTAVKVGGLDPWLPVEWFPGCVIGTNCSEPHEPYLNLIYSATNATDQKVEWEAVGSQTRVAKALTSGGAIPDCTNVANYPLCTSNGYDRDGGIVTNKAPILNGVLYIEGVFTCRATPTTSAPCLCRVAFREPERRTSGSTRVWSKEPGPRQA